MRQDFMLETLDRLADKPVPDFPENRAGIDHDNEDLAQFILGTLQLPDTMPGMTVVSENHTGVAD
jgi:hypothetical protein